MDLASCTLDGNNINDGTNYTTTLPAGWDDVVSLMDSHETAFGPPLFTRKRPGPRKLVFTTKCSSEANRRQLMRWLGAGEAETSTHTFYLDAIGWADTRTIYGVCSKVAALPGRLVQAEILCHDPTKYGAYALLASDASATASPMTKAVANTGDAPLPIVLRMSPSTSPTNRYRLYLRVYNNHNVPLTDYWFLVTWDHATNVGAARSQADGDDVRVFVDAKEVPRYCPNWNNAASRIWWRMDLPAYDRQYLNGGPNGSGVGSTPILLTDTPPFDIRLSRALKAATGFLLIDSEAFAYRRLDSYRLTVTKRALMQTSAANHGYAAAVIYIPHEVVIEFGDLTKTAPSYSTPQPSFNLTNSNSAVRSWDITVDDFGAGAVERDEAWKYSNQKGHRGAIFRSTVPSGSWESHAQRMYGGVALSRGYYAGYPDIGLPYNTWYWQSPIPIDRVRSVVIQTSANPAYAICKLMYRSGPLNQAGARYVNIGYGPAASTYNTTEATYTALTVADTATGLNSPEIAFVLHQVQFRDIWPRDRFRLHSLIVDLDSTKTPVITPASPIGGAAHVTEADWSFGIETSTGKQRLEVGIKNTHSDRYLEVNCITGELYWYEKATASAVTNAATPENEKTPAAATIDILHQGGKWLEIVKGGENVVIDFTGSARVKMQIIAPMRYV